MGDMTVGDRLLESCEELYNKNVLTRNQYKQCIDAMDGGDKFKKIKIAEQNIFSSSREAKENKYENFLKSVKQVIDELFKKLETEAPAAADPSADSQIVRNFNNTNRALIQVVILMQNVRLWIQDLSIKRHQGTESQHYDQLLYYYNKIDSQRTELEEVQKQFNTLEKKSEHQEYRTKDDKTGYTLHLNIMISLIVLLIICLVIIFLLYFI